MTLRHSLHRGEERGERVIENWSLEFLPAGRQVFGFWDLEFRLNPHSFHSMNPLDLLESLDYLFKMV
jgi:hypothetical protein